MTEPALDRPEEEAALSAPGGDSARGVGAPLAAMAQAFRAQAEAIERIQSTQRQIADTLERSEKATGVIASTRALNETFRGLTEVQRGLLDAVVKERGRGGRGLPWAFGVIALLALLLGALLFERMGSSAQVPVEVLREAQARNEELGAEAERARARAAAGEAKEAELLTRTERAERAAADEARRAEAFAKEVESLQGRVRERAVELEEFLRMKAEAERASQLELEVIGLQQRVQAAEARAERSEKEREAMAALALRDRLDQRSPADALLQEARDKGLLTDAPPAPPSGVVELGPSDRRLLRQRLNRLLQQAEAPESHDVIDIGAIQDGTRLLGVKLGAYDGPRLLHAIEAKELEVWVDPAKDTVELRLFDGWFSSVARPEEKIPFPDGRHSIFLRGAGVKAWLEVMVRSVAVSADGRLTWKTASS
ncbi:MAG: hypothetical protein ACT4PV_12650 [Planctomycetaceae bacterium]